MIGTIQLRRLPVAVLSAGLALSALVGCGKFEAPVIPEAATPDIVGSLGASVTKNAIVLTWSSPMVDRREEKLKSLDGYRVERKIVAAPSDIDPNTFAVHGPSSGFTLLGEVRDESLSNLDALREQARAEKKPLRRVKAEAEYTTFQFEDPSVKLGDHLLYRVVPFNEYGLGRVARLARVVFRGIGSEITYPEPVAVDEDLGFDPFR